MVYYMLSECFTTELQSSQSLEHYFNIKQNHLNSQTDVSGKNVNWTAQNYLNTNQPATKCAKYIIASSIEDQPDNHLCKRQPIRCL